MRVGDIVKIIKKDSAFENYIGAIISQGNGENWQVEVIQGVGVYFSIKELERVR